MGVVQITPFLTNCLSVVSRCLGRGAPFFPRLSCLVIVVRLETRGSGSSKDISEAEEAPLP